MNNKKKPFNHKKFDVFVLGIFLMSLAIVVIYVVTDQIPEWSHEWGLIFEIVNSLAVSVLCSTVFYGLTVFAPEYREKKRQEQKASIEFKALKRDIDNLGLFLVSNANKISGKENEEIVIDSSTIKTADHILSTHKKWSDDSFYKVLQIQVNNIVKQVELLLSKYEGVLSDDMVKSLIAFKENSGFYCILETQIYDKTADKLLKHELFSEYYPLALKIYAILERSEGEKT